MLKKIFKINTLLFAVFLSTSGFSHGENKPGPNGGYIRMPGAFHTELVMDKSSRVARVYLIDLSFKNPTTENSEITVGYVNGEELKDLICSNRKSFFECSIPKEANLETGKLLVKPKRLGMTGVEVVYKLPLSFSDIAH